MTSVDWLLIFLGAGIVIFMTFARLVRGVFAVVAVWSTTLMSAALYREAAFRMQALAGDNLILFRGIVFAALLVILFVVGLILTWVAFPVTKLPKMGLLDNLGGLLLGAVVAVVLVSLINNSLGLMVIERWNVNEDGWLRLRTTYYASQIRPYTIDALRIYRWLFVPFFDGLPPALVPY